MALLADTKDESYEDFMGILGIETKGIGVPMGAVPLSFPETSVEARIEEIFVAHKNSRRRRNRGTKVDGARNDVADWADAPVDQIVTPLEDKEDARDDGEADRYEIPEEAIGEGEQTDFPPKGVRLQVDNFVGSTSGEDTDTDDTDQLSSTLSAAIPIDHWPSRPFVPSMLDKYSQSLRSPSSGAVTASGRDGSVAADSVAGQAAEGEAASADLIDPEFSSVISAEEKRLLEQFIADAQEPEKEASRIEKCKLRKTPTDLTIPPRRRIESISESDDEDKQSESGVGPIVAESAAVPHTVSTNLQAVAAPGEDMGLTGLRNAFSVPAYVAAPSNGRPTTLKTITSTVQPMQDDLVESVPCLAANNDSKAADDIDGGESMDSLLDRLTLTESDSAVTAVDDDIADAQFDGEGFNGGLVDAGQTDGSFPEDRLTDATPTIRTMNYTVTSTKQLSNIQASSANDVHDSGNDGPEAVAGGDDYGSASLGQARRLSNGDIRSHSAVLPFSLDDTFDYDNVVLTEGPGRPPWAK